jgi:hypothetical protein
VEAGDDLVDPRALWLVGVNAENLSRQCGLLCW